MFTEILVFLAWAAVTYLVVVVFNMIAALPVGAIADAKWETLDQTAQKEGRSTVSVLPRQTYLVLAVGALSGIILYVSLAAVTHYYVSSHWLYKLTLFIFLISASQHNQTKYRNYSTSDRVTAGQMFGRTGSRFCLLMFGGYFWGGLAGMVLITLLLLSV